MQSNIQIQHRTPIKYYGGKTRMLPHILPLIPAHRIYVEGFAGGAALFWAKEPSKIEVLNDINRNVATFYKVMKTNFVELLKLVETTLHCEGTFKHCKKVYHSPSGYSEVERAWAFFVCTNMSYGAEAAGSFQWVKNKNDNWPPAVSIANRRIQFQEYIKRLETVCVHCMEAEKLIPKRDSPDVFFYLDPPYAGARQGHYSGYTQEMFDELLEILSRIEGKFLLSSYSNESLNKYVNINAWHQKEFDKRLGVAGGDRRKTEVLTWNYEL
ncbi:DNA adenine methylase [Leeuwenhoekiella sp. A16]|uniref:DNA adenine methylase n=1 Tax=Leeuwenhoekiella sp. A16 TaxID=3141462 RepID=UPI003A7FAE79